MSARDIDCPVCAPECHDGGCLTRDRKTGRVHHHYCSTHHAHKGHVMTPTDYHCTDCGACPDEPCRQSDGRSVGPHPARRAIEVTA